MTVLHSHRAASKSDQQSKKFQVSFLFEYYPLLGIFDKTCLIFY